MKRILLLSVFFSSLLTGMDAVWIDEEDAITLSSFTTAIHQRYYYIARLKMVHELLETLHMQHALSTQEYQALSHIAPQHPRIIRCIHDMQELQSCSPLFELWHEITAYKYVNESDCIAEYSALVCIIAQQLTTRLKEQLSIEQQKTLSSLAQKDISTDINSPDIVYRYYILKRLQPVRALLNQCATLSFNYQLQEYMPSCSQQRIMQCIDRLETEGTLDPLFKVLEDLEQFQEVTELSFVYELLQLLLIVEQHVFAPYFLPRSKELCAHYEHDIEGLSIEELLKSIDILTAHITPYAQKDEECTNAVSVLGKLVLVACSAFAALNTILKL